MTLILRWRVPAAPHRYPLARPRRHGRGAGAPSRNAGRGRDRPARSGRARDAAPVRLDASLAATWVLANPLGRIPTVHVFLASGEPVLTDVRPATSQITVTSPRPSRVLSSPFKSRSRMQEIMNGLDLQSQKIVSLADPSANTDAANKQYVDNVARGLHWKAPVRAATTANGALASAFANGQSIDGVTLATNDRILIKNQTTAAKTAFTRSTPAVRRPVRPTPTPMANWRPAPRPASPKARPMPTRCS